MSQWNHADVLRRTDPYLSQFHNSRRPGDDRQEVNETREALGSVSRLFSFQIFQWAEQ